jgi:heme-degrading monooxygenase HmoA
MDARTAATARMAGVGTAEIARTAGVVTVVVPVAANITATAAAAADTAAAEDIEVVAVVITAEAGTADSGMKFVFEIIIKPGHTVEEYTRAWKRGSAIIQKEPGALGTRLHQKIGEPEKLLAIASWKSKRMRDEAMERLAKADLATREIINKHREFGDLRLIGEYEEPEWIVEPEME